MGDIWESGLVLKNHLIVVDIVCDPPRNQNQMKSKNAHLQQRNLNQMRSKKLKEACFSTGEPKHYVSHLWNEINARMQSVTSLVVLAPPPPLPHPTREYSRYVRRRPKFRRLTLMVIKLMLYSQMLLFHPHTLSDGSVEDCAPIDRVSCMSHRLSRGGLRSHLRSH
jgi:hypothetical protein